jgi:hypothetical protein
MVEDKYIGLALAVSGTVAIGSSFIITKKVHAAILQSDDLLTSSRRASMKQEREETRILKHLMTTLTSKILSGGQGWQSVSIHMPARFIPADVSDALSVVLGECAFHF